MSQPPVDTDPGSPAPGPGVPVCHRHPGRETYIRCQRCDRPICPDCMHEAAVGFQCPDCVRAGSKETRQGRTPYGGRVRGGPPVVTYALIGLNLLVFVLIQVTGGRQSRLLPELGLMPTGGVFVGADGVPYYADGVADGAVWQLVTAMFTHLEVWHILFNMFALYLLGPQLEILLGRVRFTLLYFMSGLVGSVAVYWLAAPSSMTIGASGAIFGLMGALVVVARRVRADTSALLALIGINTVITVLGAQYISWQGHLGGLVGGLLLGTALVYSPRRGRTRWQVLGLTVVAVALVLLTLVRTVLLA
jgi:membrane associated rhomboid family serine protease